jgi:hypothetical protein
MTSGASAASSRTLQKFTKYGSVTPRPYGTETSILLKEDHHALVFSFCVGVAATAGPSSAKLPLRLRSTNSRVKSFGRFASDVTRTRTEDS